MTLLHRAAPRNQTDPRAFRSTLLLGAAFSLLALPMGANAQSAEDDEVIVTGTRQIIQDAIALKRESTQIVDGLSAAEIGDLPALSIGEALETITGAASHRENGGATEISIRGLGPFLSATNFNGREATNGSGDRSVNFSQFPSELINKLAIYKTQDASLIEGGVAGLISLETLKPLEYNKRRIQLDLKGNVNPSQLDQDDTIAGDYGYRGTLSFVDQFEIPGLGDVGVAFGAQRSDISQPEQEVRSSSPSDSSLFACIIDPANTDRGYGLVNAGDCEDSRSNSIPGLPAGVSPDNIGYVTYIDPNTGLAVDDGTPFAWAPSSRGYRQNDTGDQRDSVFAALQWQPNDRTDFNLDVQWSERAEDEVRNDLNFANMRRVTPGVTLASLVASDTGVVSAWEGGTQIESNSEVYNRTEKYLGGGLGGAFEATEKLTLKGDISYSETKRTERQVSIRTQSDPQDAFQNPSTARTDRPNVYWDTSSGIPQYTITNFDVTDHAQFADEYRYRIDNDVNRTHKATAIRGDFEYATDIGFLTSVEGGLRVSELSYEDFAGTRLEATVDDSSAGERDAIARINVDCATQFPESSFLSSVRSGPLITTVDSSGNILSTSNSWATFDNACVTNAILDFYGDSFAYPDVADEAAIDVKETTKAIYLKANYEGQLRTMPVRGNFGLRILNTSVDSTSPRTAYNVETNPSSGALSLVATGDTELVSAGGDYTVFLPSFSAVIDVKDDFIVRGGIFRGLSRSDPADMGFSRRFSVNTDDEILDPNALINSVNASGNPFVEPLTSWNYDISGEWYPDADSILSLGLYLKKFKGGFESALSSEVYSIDGQQITVPVTLLEVNTDESTLYGFEVTASTRFSNLPGYLSGLGAKLSYNYANSDYEFEDSLYGDIGFRDQVGNYVQTNIGILAPGNIPGFSEHVLSAQAYYQIGEFDASLIYKYRSDYFQPYTSNGTRLRFVGDVGVWEARASYDVSDKVRLSVEAINLFDAPKEQYFFTPDNLGEVNVYGARVFAGIRAKF